MIEAELHGKSHVAEDRLTSTCLGLLRLLPDSYLLEFLGKAETLEGQRLSAARYGVIADISFWPYLVGAGEPDAIIRLGKSDGSATLTLIVEAKHGAPKSGFEALDGLDAPQNDATTDRPAEQPLPRDQLAKYLQAGKRDCQQVNLVYLTHHRSAPRRDIEESLKAAGGGSVIFWLSWFELYSCSVNWLASDRSLEFSACKILEALRSYLEFQGYVRFRLWSPLSLPNTGSPTMYRRTYGLSVPRVLPAPFYARGYSSAFTPGGSALLLLYQPEK